MNKQPGNFFEFIREKFIPVTLIILLVLGLTLALFLLQKTQIFRSKATANQTVLNFGSTGIMDLGNIELNQEFDLILYINAGDKNPVTGVDVTIKYDKTTINPVSVTPLSEEGDPAGYSNLETTLIPSDGVASINPDGQTIHYVGVNNGYSSDKSPRSGYFPLIKIKFKAVGLTSAVNPGKIWISRAQVVGINNFSSALPTDISSTAKYTILGSIIPLPTCSVRQLELGFSNTAEGTFLESASLRLNRASGQRIFAKAFDQSGVVKGKVLPDAEIVYREEGDMVDLPYRDASVSGVLIGSEKLIFTAKRDDRASCTTVEEINVVLPPTATATPPPTRAPIVGDCTFNYCVDSEDVDKWKSEKNGTLKTKDCDFDRSGKVDQKDYQIIRNHLGDGCDKP